MNNKIWAVLGTIIVVIIPVLLGYYISISKPDVRYTLSEEIPLSFSVIGGSESENVQQLEIRNVGSAGAEKIAVKISKNISDYKIIKHLAIDDVEVFIDQMPVQFIYPELPPEAGFKIIFISPNIVEVSDINISHSTGKAIDALTVSNKSSTYLTLGIYGLIFGGYLIWIAISFRNLSFNSWKFETKMKRIDLALKSPKPWYLTDLPWVTAHLETIKQLLKEEYVPQEKVANSASYGLLNEQKPDHFGEYDWKEINVLAVSLLKDHLSKSIDSYSESSILSVISLPKPERFPNDDWNSIQDKANEKYLERNKNKIYGKKQMVELLYKEKPEVISQKIWDVLQNYCKKSYFEELIYDIDMSEDPKSRYKNIDLNLLDQNQKKKLEDKIEQISKYNDYRKILDSFFTKKKIPLNKPDNLSEFEWQEIKFLENLYLQKNDLETKEEELAHEKIELSKKQAEFLNEKKLFSELKNKVINQLEFINDFLNDPLIINKVESYDDTFSPGNWNNLKRLAILLENKE